ncbi:MAG: hypothetical protein H0U18_13405 [Pyrinomonadaceae bacterium]|nr:hypothetical protein [Pyrinomonadaceae bacterium]
MAVSAGQADWDAPLTEYTVLNAGEAAYDLIVLMQDRMTHCVVSFVDTDGVGHSLLQFGTAPKGIGTAPKTNEGSMKRIQ